MTVKLLESVEETLFNVMVSRKLRGKPVETSYFSVNVPKEEDEHTYIRAYVKRCYDGWILGGYAPARVEQSE